MFIFVLIWVLMFIFVLIFSVISVLISVLVYIPCHANSILRFDSGVILRIIVPALW